MRPKKEETDEEMAQRLHGELNSTRARTTRGGGDGTAKKKSTWKKRKNTGEDGSNAPRKRSSTGFNKPHLLSDALADVVGKPVASRPQVTKLIWVISSFQVPRSGTGSDLL